MNDIIFSFYKYLIKEIKEFNEEVVYPHLKDD